MIPTASTNTAAAATDVVITIAAASGTQHLIRHISWSYDIDLIAVARVGDLKVESPSGTNIGQWDIIQGGPGALYFDDDGLPGASGAAVIVTLNGVTGAIGKLNITRVN